MITNKAKITQILSWWLWQQILDKNLSYKLGQRIKQIRAEKNISQQDLASKCNFDKSNMSRIEAGRTDPVLSTLYRIANGLEVEIAELFKF